MAGFFVAKELGKEKRKACNPGQYDLLNHNKPSAYIIPAEAFEVLMEKLEDYEMGRIVKERESEPSVKVSLGEL